MYSNKRNIAAAILAGGKNLRMNGQDKAFIKINGIPLIEKIIYLLKEIFPEIILVTNNPQNYNLYKNDTVIVQDLLKNLGPLGGIHTALSVSSKENIFVVACDMPFLHSGLIYQELDCFNKVNPEALVPRIGFFIEPLHAIYKKGLEKPLFRFLKNSDNYAIRNFLGQTDTYYWDLKDDFSYQNIFKNLNTKKELEVFIKI